MSNDWQHDEWWVAADELSTQESRRALGPVGDKEDARDG